MAQKTEMQKDLEALMKEWKDYSKKTWPKAPFVFDGFFPEYEGQGYRILFIGRESYGEADNDYIRALLDGEMRNTDNFHSRLLYIAYGILNGEHTISDWIKMPNAKQLNHVFAEKDGFSYAFMNASKLNNNSGTTDVDAGLFSDFIADPQNQAYFLKEIEILAPDIIISGNLGDKNFMTPFLESKKVQKKDCDNKNFLYYELTLNGKLIPWLDGWHFSARRGSFDSFYNPICSKAKDILGKKK